MLAEKLTDTYVKMKKREKKLKLSTRFMWAKSSRNQFQKGKRKPEELNCQLPKLSRKIEKKKKVQCGGALG